MKNKPLKTENLPNRPPIVVVMGHIDHGKSTLLDYIRKADFTSKAAKSEPHPIAGREAGGITQHIGAYEAETEHEGKKRKITFLDTPGHEAFSKMRTRGANVADIAVLVVAADDGVQPQTIEAHNTLKEAGLPFIVAINKMDKPGADPEKIKTQLAESGIYIEGYGGTVPFAKISAKTGEGVPELLDVALILADMENLQADTKLYATGIVIESNMDPKRGISSTLLIKNGTLKKGMFVLAGKAMSPVRILENFLGQPIEEASFSSPVRITGFSELPAIGDEFKAYADKNEAEKALDQAKETTPIQTKDSKQNIDEETNPLRQSSSEVSKITVKMIIKTDTAGSLEALEKELMKLKDEETAIELLKGGVGNINEDDARFSSAAKNTVILGFNVGTDIAAKEIVDRHAVPAFTSDIIYKISDWLKKEIAKRKAEIPREEIIGAAKILKTFSRQKNKQVIGGKVVSGKLIEGKSFKIKRKDVEIGEGKIINLQQGKKEVKEVSPDEEFGAMTENKIEIARDDEIIIIGK
ncbi:MAG: translation initiation factor IF-2 [Candidatus Terrybacteria bacterium RIFCSPLOWO2_02_42_20]|uniref:Translation initiation factor IF-2 n=2 Tax=Candidatus Terryibacteriota TaxID=1817920 RepID=A0A1G2PMP0_9BACT|nr:MAG: translation initiation factor IF-2 [Candidatus Terrybacteria bacterium RIFCSPHIGHO2_02_41_19]OHA54066.1 MAG: translation initiation factor IF-2 [Candidatus Terrybacteria bacterium RIFCSPLOWO2_02_42_20]